MNDYDEIRKALNHLDANDRDFWVKMGAAIKDELGDNGFELWDEWSQQSDNYKANDAKSVWKSLKSGHIHIATLFYHAREHGYRPDKPYIPPSPDEMAKRAAESAAKRQAEQERIAQAHAKAEKTAYGIWKNANPASLNHAYAQNKGLNAESLQGIRQNEYQGKKQLIIPLYSDKKLVNIQTIDEQGNKKFLNGGQKQGAYTIIGDFKQNQQGIILAEGFATAASVHQATGKPVVVAFDAGNLKAVSEKLQKVLPEQVPVYFAADNDVSQTGLKKAQAAAEIWGERAKILLPEFTPQHIQQYQQQFSKEKMPSDFNDLHQLAGIEAVRNTLGMPTPEIKQPEAKPEMSREELFKNNYWRVSNGYDPLTETPQPEPKQDLQQPEKENIMENKAKFELGQAVKHENPHLTDVSLVVGKSPNGYVLLDNEPVSSPYLQEVNGTEFEASTDKAWLNSLVYENKNAEKAYKNFEQNQSRYPSEYEWISKADFMKAFGQEPELKQDHHQEMDFRQPEIIHNDAIPMPQEADLPPYEPPEYLDEYWENLSTEPPTATSEQDVAVSVSEYHIMTESHNIHTETETHQHEMSNGIEYDGLQHEHDVPTTEKQATTEAKSIVPPTAKLNIADLAEPEPSHSDPSERERTQPILDLAYERPPKNLQSRYVVAENGQYLSADNYHTVLFEDKGKELRTAKSDYQTIQDMLEVAKAKGWDSIKISGSPEFKAMMYVAAESQGIKTSGYKPTPADLKMLEKMREDRALNGIQSIHKPELNPKQPEQEKTINKPDVAALSAADKLKTQSAMPDERHINVSPIADTEVAPKTDVLGNKTIPSEVLRNTQSMTDVALSSEVVNAKAAYDQKSQQLSAPNQARLKAYEHNVMDVLRDVQGDARNHALRNFYEHTTQAMNGTELNLPQPMQNRVPSHHQTYENQPSVSQDFEMER